MKWTICDYAVLSASVNVTDDVIVHEKRSNVMDKKSLRQYIKEEKQRHTATELSLFDSRLFCRIVEHPRVKEAGTVLLYWSLPDEVDTHTLVESLAASGKTVLLPRVEGGTELSLRRFTAVEDMVRGAYGILEPQGEEVSAEALAALMPHEADGTEGEAAMVAIIPGVAFDAEGHRLGRGKGYYDRLLARLPKMHTIGLCYPFQYLDSVPAENWDMAVDEVIS